MKKIFVILFFFFLGIFAYLFIIDSGVSQQFTRKYFYKSVCSEPIYYKIGKVDSRFGLSKKEVIKNSEIAGGIWNEAVSKKIFAYSPDGKLTINMVYDFRQSLNTQIDQLEEDLDNGKTSLDEEVRKYRILSDNFEAKKDAFQQKVKEWNKNQNGTEEEYNKLIEEQNELTNEAERLNLTARQLNLDANLYNNKIENLNEKIGSFNNALDYRPEEGIYDPNTNTINIYFNNDQNELIRTIAHEMGHARGLEHLSDKNSIMYPKTNKVLTPTAAEVAMLKEICEPIPIYKPYLDNFKLNLKMVSSSLN